MDMGAYMKIETIKPIVEKNNIIVDRVRGYRLMSDEESINQHDLNEIIQKIFLSRVDDLFAMRNDEVFGRCLCYDEEYDANKKKYLRKDGSLRWELISGDLKKNIEFVQTEVKLLVGNQYDLWNRFAKCSNVLYIHAKLGSSNWSGIYHKTYENEPWYLDSCDDAFDAAYCDIYAKLEDS